ncbi:MAG: lysozyme inhibitor LprI family protein, partial [Aestuariivirgaceae bacterium]|nr:lysozyme inhibitor LprI family protein [Aestuariivirgaceae bacterium]
MGRLGFVMLLLACAGTPAQAFDCAKAATQVERTICANPELKVADDAMGAAYKALKARLAGDEAAELLQSQRVWLASRNDCAAFA